MIYEVVELSSGDTKELDLLEPRIGEHIYTAFDDSYFMITDIVKRPKGKNGECWDPVLYVSYVTDDGIRFAEKLAETHRLALFEPRIGEHIYTAFDDLYFRITDIVKRPKGKNGECWAPVLYVSYVDADGIRFAEKLAEKYRKEKQSDTALANLARSKGFL